MPVAHALQILVVEDYPDGAESLAQLLALYDHNVRTAGEGDEALRLWSEEPADVVILDIWLPGSDGYDVAKKLCAESKHRPLLVALTGVPNLEARSRSEGFDHHFLKPVNPKTLAAVLRAHAAKLTDEPTAA
jgi:DNA-binding response OmpR family regulator